MYPLYNCSFVCLFYFFVIGCIIIRVGILEITCRVVIPSVFMKHLAFFLFIVSPYFKSILRNIAIGVERRKLKRRRKKEGKRKKEKGKRNHVTLLFRVLYQA